MKKLIFFALCIGMFSSLTAQSTYNVIRLFDTDLSGTARFIGMGGAMGALGGDISTMSTNPAGIGVYRSNDIVVSTSINTIGSKASFTGVTKESDNSFLSFDNIGIVLGTAYEDSPIRTVNFGVNYKRRNNFSKDFAMAGSYIINNTQFSQQYQMQQQYDNLPPSFDLNNITSESYHNPNLPWLLLLGTDAGLLNKTDADIYALPTDAAYRSKETGGVDAVDFNMSMNINDRVYVGITVGTYHVNYNKSSFYGEYDEQGNIYTLENWHQTTGNGFDIKLGTILRPIEESPFRVGVSIHTPTWYTLTDYSSAYIRSTFKDANNNNYHMDTRSNDAYGSDYAVEYNLTSPWKFNTSLGYTIGNYLALGFEYEYSDYSTSRMKYVDGFNMPDMDDEFKSNMREVHTLRVGLEFKPANDFSLRCGYNYISSAFDKNAWKYISTRSTTTSTEYTNTMETNNFTLGLGFRFSNFYIDASYLLSMQSADFYTYYDQIEALPATKVTNTRNQFMLSMGLKF